MHCFSLLPFFKSIWRMQNIWTVVDLLRQNPQNPNPGTRSSWWLWVLGVSGNSGFLESQGTMGFWSSVWLQEPRVPGDSGVTGTPDSWNHTEIRVLGVTRNSRFPDPEFSDTPVSRNHPKILEPESPGLWFPGVSRNCVLQDSPGTPGSRIRPDLWVPGVTRNSGFP